MAGKTVSIAAGRMPAILLGVATIAAVSACGREPTWAASAADLPAVAPPGAQQMEPARGSRPPDGAWRAGTHYEVLEPPVGSAMAPGKVRVIEFFWYACSHCYVLEVDLRAWLDDKPDYVEFVRVPVTWRAQQTAHARLYYTLRALGRGDLDSRVFETIHERKNRLFADNDGETFRLHLGFAKAHGIRAREFSAAYYSKAVDAELANASLLAKECRVVGVPTMVVNGKYLTSGKRAGSGSNLIAVASSLAAREANP